MSFLERDDPDVAAIIERERQRQVFGLELIASENVVTRAVMEATGSIMCNKYAEGYPGKRYYGGCEFHDEVENLARERLCRLFSAEHSNVQAHSGSQANQAVYFATIQPKDAIMSQSLTQGGHLSHGSPVNISGKLYDVHPYGVDYESEVLDYGAIAEMAREVKPKMIVCGASAYPREIDFAAFAEIAEDVGAVCMADIAHIAGLVAAGIHNSPVSVCDYTTTTTHKTLRGPRGGAILCRKEDAQMIDKSIFPGLQGGPLMHVIAAKAVCFKEALKPDYKEYAKQVVKNAKVLADTLADNNLRLCSGGTDNHLVLLDLSDQGITGLEAEDALGLAGITVNKNTIPREKRSPFVTSGLRVGTPTVTSRGMKEDEMKLIGDWIGKVINNIQNDSVIRKVKEEVAEFSGKYPLYPDAS
ncbi:MAG: serine hydroxymethyltransferase [Methanocalculus sp. MSAO_Arc1]|uniref:serine hydroxymethyltransferase n=1 Tax=Methanocalculus TaxID=71151 RepID=UPI000FF70278|nr:MULTISPECIES: serine hydroxymethyltransferase [unclassified Methanocalculus]MCP1663290.1 glycine hydroxymethyltransferase [Methanocalculus sp. AMF5]RQD79549.1 MAG: serine hydroxymethyltransferase [Methanocalculus sp. MSAO_Arc1]